MPTKPVILINHLYEPRDRISGISSYLFSLLAALLDRGDFDYVLATNWSAAALPETLRRDALRVESLGLPESTPRNVAAQLVQVPRLMRKHRASLEFNVNPVGGFIARWPKVITVHDLYFDVNPHQYKAHHVLWWRLFFPLARRSATSIICVSQQTRADLTRFHPAAAAKAVVVHEAALHRPDGAADRARKPYGLFVANVSPNKGCDVLVAAMAGLERRGTPIEVLHVGDDGGRIKAAQAKLGTTAGPRSLGRVDAATLDDLYRHASFLAFPSSYEGFGLPVLEAQAFGVPVVASDIPVLREVAGEGALYFTPGDPEGLGEQMRALLAEPPLWRRLHQGALRNVRRFSWPKAAEETEAVFGRALSRFGGM